MKEVKENGLLRIGNGLYRVLRQEINGSWKCKCIAMKHNKVSIGDTVRLKTIDDIGDPDVELENWAIKDGLSVGEEYIITDITEYNDNVYISIKGYEYYHTLIRFESLNDETNRVEDIVYFFLDNLDYKVVR